MSHSGPSTEKKTQTTSIKELFVFVNKCRPNGCWKSSDNMSQKRKRSTSPESHTQIPLLKKLNTQPVSPLENSLRPHVSRLEREKNKFKQNPTFTMLNRQKEIHQEQTSTFDIIPSKKSKLQIEKEQSLSSLQLVNSRISRESCTEPLDKMLGSPRKCRLEKEKVCLISICLYSS